MEPTTSIIDDIKNAGAWLFKSEAGSSRIGIGGAALVIITVYVISRIITHRREK